MNDFAQIVSVLFTAFVVVGLTGGFARLALDFFKNL